MTKIWFSKATLKLCSEVQNYTRALDTLYFSCVDNSRRVGSLSFSYWFYYCILTHNSFFSREPRIQTPIFNKWTGSHIVRELEVPNSYFVLILVSLFGLRAGRGDNGRGWYQEWPSYHSSFAQWWLCSFIFRLESEGRNHEYCTVENVRILTAWCSKNKLTALGTAFVKCSGTRLQRIGSARALLRLPPHVRVSAESLNVAGAFGRPPAPWADGQDS